MARILAIDFGRKRIGLAVSDPDCIFAFGLDTVETATIWTFLDNYLKTEKVDCFVVGNPKTLSNQPSESVEFLLPFIEELKKKYPMVKLEFIDERFTSKMAFQAMIDGGLKKMQRRNKALIDKTSAVILLQSYLEKLQNQKKIKYIK